MSTTDINLLLRTDQESLRTRRKIKILNTIAVAALTVVATLSLILFVSVQIVNPASVKEEQGNISSKLSQFQDRQAKLFLLNDRIGNIDKLLKIRKDLSKTTSGLLAKMPSNFLVDDIEINDKSVVINGQSSSLFTIGEFINNLTDMVRNKEIIKSLTLNSLLLDEGNRAYQVSVRSDL